MEVEAQQSVIGFSSRIPAAFPIPYHDCVTGPSVSPVTVCRMVSVSVHLKHTAQEEQLML
jgi:hypothetical protein